MKFVCIGDSLTYGYGAAPGEGWVELLSRQPGLTVLNRGECGDTTAGMGVRLYTSTVIPNRGAWIELETDANGVVYARIDRNRKIPATVLIRALGWASNADIMPKPDRAGIHIATPVFDGAHAEDVFQALKIAGLPEDGKTVLYDGRTGEPMDRRVTVGYVYMIETTPGRLRYNEALYEPLRQYHTDKVMVFTNPQDALPAYENGLIDSTHFVKIKDAEGRILDYGFQAMKDEFGVDLINARQKAAKKVDTEFLDKCKKENEYVEVNCLGKLMTDLGVACRIKVKAAAVGLLK